MKIPIPSLASLSPSPAMTPNPNPDLRYLIRGEKDYRTVNKLIMVGNGFDLAHGLRSGFNHFIFDYIQNALKILAKDWQYSDSQVQLKNSNTDPFKITYGLVDSNCMDRFDKIYDKYIKSKLLEKIIIEIESKKWVDIEVSFYDMLIPYLINNNHDGIKDRNIELEQIRLSLIKYLRDEEKREIIEPNSDLLSQFAEPIFKGDVLLNTIEDDMISANSYYFLNFNYTNILKKYVEKMPPNTSTLNHIHGALNTDDSNGQDPIFGFGDEFDKNYSAFEDLRDDSAFEHIKSFKYLEAENYRNLMEFVESNPFQVSIFGHSCGVSDRTMLNKIFEHENCISIKTYYYQNGNWNDYTTKNYSIARCFKDKSSLRDKVANFSLCSPMVQPGLGKE